jgi:hypothetical protein
MGINYSQKRLMSGALHAKGNSLRARRLRLYAFLTGLMSMLITLAQLILVILTGG